MTLAVEATPVFDLSVIPADAALLPLTPLGAVCERDPKDPNWDVQVQEYGPGAADLCARRREVLMGEGLISCGQCACSELIQIAEVDPVYRAELADKIVNVNTPKETK